MSMLLPGGWNSVTPVAIRLLGSTGGDGDANHNFYHLRNTWNSTQEYLMVIHTGPGTDWTVALHHGLSGAWIRDMYQISQRDWRGCWSKVLPNIWYTWKGTHVYVIDVETNTVKQDFVAVAGNYLLPTGTVIHPSGNRILIPCYSFSPTTHHIRSYDLDPVTGFIGGGAASFSYDPATGSPIFYPEYYSANDDKYVWARDGDKIALLTAAQQHSGNTQVDSTATVIHLAEAASATSGVYVGNRLLLRPSPFFGQIRRIVAYDGPNRRATVDPGFTSAPGSGVSYSMDFNNVTIIRQDGTLINHLRGGSFGHGDYNGGNYASCGVAAGLEVPMRIWMWKENTVGTTEPVLVFTAGGSNLPKPRPPAQFHLTFADNVPTKLFVGPFPSYGTGFYPYPGGTYTPNVGGAWNSANSEVNTHCPYDEIFTLTTNDNWTTQAGITVKYLGRTLTRNFNAPESFWCQPQPVLSKDGTRIFFNSRDGDVLRGYILTEETPMAWAVTVRIPRHADPEVVNYKTYLGGIYQATVPQPAVGDPEYTYAMAIDGDYVLTSTALDAAGNESPQSPALNVHLDHVAPGAPAVMVFVSSVWS